MLYIAVYTDTHCKIAINVQFKTETMNPFEQPIKAKQAKTGPATPQPDA